MGCNSAISIPTLTATPEATTASTVFEYEIIDPVDIPSGDIVLVGRVYMPQGEGPFPGIVYVHGSGRSTRDQVSRDAIALAEAGYAVLRYDKRGVGDSGGLYSQVGPSNSEQVLSELAGDVLSGVEFLGSFENVDAGRIGLIGNSQAGWIIPLAASQSDAVAFAVNIVGPAVSVGEENFYSRQTLEDPARLSDEFLEDVSAALTEYAGPRGFDPREAIQAMDIPALWVLGGRDASIPTRETVAILEKIIEEYDKDFTVYVYPLGTHSMINVETGERIDFFGEVITPWLAEVSSSN